MSNARKFEVMRQQGPGRFLAATAGLTLAWNAALAGPFNPEGTQYLAAGSPVGDQILPAAAFRSSGGWMVWQDNSTDGLGFGISARRLTGQLTGLSSFRVNEVTAGDQENVQVALLPDGAALIVWQTGKRGSQSISARIVKADGKFATSEFTVSANGTDNREPSVAVNPDGTALVVWSAEGVDGEMQAVQGRLLSANGTPLGDAFQINQYTKFHQRSAAVTALSGGSFVVSWISEHQRGANSVDVYARLVSSEGAMTKNEFLVNSAQRPCATPALAALPNDGFLAAWGEHDSSTPGATWDIYSRVYGTSGPLTSPQLLNTRQSGFQGVPKLAPTGDQVLAVYRSAGGDGVGQGVVAQWLSAEGQKLDSEFVVNSKVNGDQLYPVVASDGANRALVVWSSFEGVAKGMDLAAQRFTRAELPLSAPSVPYVFALSSSRLQVNWPELAGIPVRGYEIYVDGSLTPLAVSTSPYSINGFAPNSSHTIQIAYVLQDGRRSPLSAAASAVTWGEDDNADGLPDDWQAQFFGTNTGGWPAPSLDTDGDGVSDREEFLAGTDPKSAKSVLRTTLTSTPQGVVLSWNSRVGAFYQVQYSVNLRDWTNVGSARLAAGDTDSIPVGDLPNNAYYRVNLLR